MDKSSSSSNRPRLASRSGNCAAKAVSTTSRSLFYKWRAKFGGMHVLETQSLRKLVSRNAKLVRLLAEVHLDMHALNSVLEVKRDLHSPAGKPLGASLASTAVVIYCLSILAGAGPFIPGRWVAIDAAIVLLLSAVGVGHMDAIMAPLTDCRVTLWFAVGICVVAMAKVGVAYSFQGIQKRSNSKPVLK